MKNNSPGIKLLMVAITLALAAYFDFQAFNYFVDPLSTTLAYSYQVEDEMNLSGYVVREERVLADEASGLLRLNRAEGERVSAGGTVATVYADQASLDRQTEIDALTTRIEQLQYAKEAALGAEVSLKLDNQIIQTVLEYRGSISAEKFYEAESVGSELRALVMKRDYTHSDNGDLNGQIESLQAQLKEAKAQSAGTVRRLTAPQSGLYSAVVDGYEQILTPESAAEMTPSQFFAVQTDASVSSHVGKLILGDSWYYAAVLPTEQAEALAEEMAKNGSGAMKLRFTKNIERDLNVSLESVGEDENGKCVVVFRGDTYLPQLTLLRKQSAQLVVDSVEGIRVPKDALRIRTTEAKGDDGTVTETKTLGVYCVVGMEARFKPVEMLYSGDGFALVQATAPADRESLRLRPRDEVIITALDLYDGKVLG